MELNLIKKRTHVQNNFNWTNGIWEIKFALKLAKIINGEIINADSMQVYKEIQVLTARPASNSFKNIKHHLYGFLSVKKTFSVGNWLKLVYSQIREIRKRNKIPIIVGGTGLYFKALTYGFAKIPKVPIKIRNKIRRDHIKVGQQKFYKKLLKIDPICKKKINKNDVQRTLRAYEIINHTNISLFEWYKKTKSNFNDSNFIKVYLDLPKEDLIQRIYKRVNEMIKNGAINEVKKLQKLKIKKNNSSLKIIGINEINDFLSKKMKKDELIEILAIKTRQYAKRQRTWARGQMQNWQKINPKDFKIELKIQKNISKT